MLLIICTYCDQHCGKLWCCTRSLEIQDQTNNDEWLEHSTIVDSLSCTLKDLQRDATYRFRVRAENRHGRSEPSAPSAAVCLSYANTPPHTAGDHNTHTVKGSCDDDALDSSRPLNIKPGGDFKSRFDVHEELGKGRFGVVFRCVERDSGITLAAKVVKCIKPQNKIKV